MSKFLLKILIPIYTIITTIPIDSNIYVLYIVRNNLAIKDVITHMYIKSALNLYNL